MIYIAIRYDHPNADELRDELKGEHRAYLRSLGNRLLTGGAIFDVEQKVIGGSITFECSSFEEAKKIADQDPYSQDPKIGKETVIIPFRVRWKDGRFYDGEGWSTTTISKGDFKDANIAH